MINEGLYRIDGMLRKNGEVTWDPREWRIIGYARTLGQPHFVYGKDDEMWYTLIFDRPSNKFAVVWTIRNASGITTYMRVDFNSLHNIEEMQASLDFAPLGIGDCDYAKALFKSDKFRRAAIDTITFISKLSALFSQKNASYTLRELEVMEKFVASDIEFFAPDNIRINHVEKDHTSTVRYMCDVIWDDSSDGWVFQTTEFQPPDARMFIWKPSGLIESSTLIDSVLS